MNTRDDIFDEQAMYERRECTRRIRELVRELEDELMKKRKGTHLNHGGVRKNVYTFPKDAGKAALPRHIINGKIVVGKKVKPTLKGGD